MIRSMREREIREGLKERVEEMLRKARSRVRVEDRKGFWTRIVRRGCSANPVLFNILMANLEEEMNKVKWGGIRLREKKIYSLQYADVVLIAEEDGEMRSMVEKLERYLDRKGLELNAGKMVLKFRERGRRIRMSW